MKKLLLFFLVASICTVEARAQINAEPPQFRHEYVTPAQMVTITSNTPFNQALTILDGYSRKFLNKIIVDPENRTTLIGVDIDRMQWLDALETILRANNLWYKEYESYIQIVPSAQQVVVKGEEKAAALPPGTPTLSTREVNIEAIFFEADLTKLNSHGININFLISNTWHGITSIPTGNLPSGINSVPPTIGMNAPQSSDFTVSGQHDFSFGSLGAIFGILESEDLGKILASPEITVRSGELGHIQVGVNFFVTTRDFAGNTIQTMQNTGIIVNATPTVYSQDSVDYVSLDLNLTNSSLGGSQQTGTIINTEQANTKVLLLNGEQTTIGGLYSSTQSTHREGIPVLKDLPWWVLGLRYLTGSDQVNVQTKELIIVIKATILPTLRQRFETLQTRGPQPRKSLEQELRQLEERIKQYDPQNGK
ncbi:MAG: type II and III secretion system protein [Bacteroidetes bacterium]|nr:type II and III secretion system protein [Bacteroidota bacterium]